MARIVGTICTNCSNDKVRWSKKISRYERKVKCPTCLEETTVTPDSKRVYK